MQLMAEIMILLSQWQGADQMQHIHPHIISRYRHLLSEISDENHLISGVPESSGWHLRFMLDMIEKYDCDTKTNPKAHRWLGYVQGILIAARITTVDSERNFTRSYFTNG